MFITAHFGHSDTVQIFESRAKSDSVRDTSRSRLKLVGSGIIDGAFKRNVLYHISAAVIRLCLFEEFFLSVNRADTSRSVNLMTRENEPIRVKRRNIYGNMRY